MHLSAPELLWIIIISTVVFLMLGGGVIVIIITNHRRFLTAQKEKMQELQKSEEQYSDLFNNVSDIIYIHSLDGEILQINATLTKFLGYKKDDLIGKSLKDIFVPEYHNKVDDYLKEIAINDESRGFLHLRSKDNQDCVFEYRNSIISKNGKSIAVRGVARNVTEQMKAERSVRESEERFRRLVTFSPVPIGVHCGGRWVFVNDAGINLIGAQSSKDIIGKPLLYFIKPEFRKASIQHIRKILNQRKEAYFFEEKIFSLDGKEIEVEVVATPIIYGGKHAGQVVVHNVTERRRLQDKLARAQRLETAGRVAGQIAHDLNNLLAPLTAYPTLIRDDLPDGHSVLGLVDAMESAAKKIAEINQQLLALGRRGHYSLEPIDVNYLILKILNSHQFSKEIIVNTDFASDIFQIYGGEAQLTRALTNVIINATESMQGAGKLSIKAENVYLDEPLFGYQTVERGEFVKLEISDTGTGIDSNILDKIFDPFYTTKKMDRMRGSGLGLSIVHGIVEDHKGYITVDSALGQGTTFSLYFPISRMEDSQYKETDELLTGNGEKILIVDDDPVQRSVTGQLLKRLGYNVNLVSNGEEAIKIVTKNPQDLLILDMVMDGIDGAETYRQILKIKTDQKAIILSGYAMSQRVEEALRLGAGTFVSKPVTPLVLGSAIRKELDK